MLLVIVTVIEFLQSEEDEMIPNVNITFCHFLSTFQFLGVLHTWEKPTVKNSLKQLLLYFPHWSEHTRSVYISVSTGKFIVVF